MSKFVYAFNEGSKDLVGLLGVKGANLAEMTRIGLPVPFGFTVTTQACNQYVEQDCTIGEDIAAEIFVKLEELEEVTGKRFADKENPLLVAVRPSAACADVQTPDTILNLGLNDDIAECLSQQTANSGFAYDCYRRLQQMYEATVGCGSFPQNPKEQLLAAISAIFSAWHSTDTQGAGIAVCVQAMVFGNLGEDSCTGIAHSRNPENGENLLLGEFLQNAQGKLKAAESGRCAVKSLKEMPMIFPAAYEELMRISAVLEKYFLDMQDMEFVVERGKLCMVQTGAAKRTAEAAVKAAADMASEGLITKETAVLRIDPSRTSCLNGGCAEELEKILSWADEIRTLKIRANVDRLEELQTAAALGAEGIGLCRTEQILLKRENLPIICQAMMADSQQQRAHALEKLFQYQKECFKTIYEVMEDRPVAIRLLDAPLSAYLPHTEEDIRWVSACTGISCTQIEETYKRLQEMNPMLGHRGCRLAVTYPEMAEMQTRAIMEAAIEVQQQKGIEILPEIMEPLIGIDKEMEFVKEIVVRTAQQCSEKSGCEVRFYVGTMIEVPRAALIADKVAKEVDFFSFGASDLTQMTFGFSRNDTELMIAEYIRKGILTEDPFQTIDRDGIGSLMDTAVKAGRQVKPTLKIGLCGEHGGDPASIAFCHQLGLNYVSCRPQLLSAARIAAAQAVLNDK